MTRPEIIRADSIDLQDQNAPSAQDHTRQPAHPAPLGAGPPAPHQADTLREAALEAKEEQQRSPRVSKEWTTGEVEKLEQYGDELAAGVTSKLTGTNLQRQDNLAVAQNGGLTGSTAEDAEMADAEGDDGMDDDMMDKISSSPSIDDEDIDFEFVYALHTFVATVEGQANATKGDTMVLLDDSNSYWWLVRVVKDSSIGYLPAEHIETPTERLARLNKHRNIDLTSTMLGDQAEKSRNPLKIAIRRRNAKTVTFTAPTYVEAPDIDYSTDEDEADGDFYGQNGQQEQNGVSQQQEIQEDESATVEPLKTRTEIREVRPESTEPESRNGDATLKTSSEASRSSDEVLDGRVESKSRNGTVRNTDSFFKDDTVETRKITLTPNLLRDDSSSTIRTSNESKELKQRPSLDKLEKVSPDRNKDKSKDKRERKEKKEKEKKPGILSTMFKRKEKKTKTIDDEIEELNARKRSTSTEKERSSPSPSKESEDIAATDDQVSVQAHDAHRQTSKLQKQPRVDGSPSRKVGQGRELKPSEPQQASAPERLIPATSVQTPSMRLVQPETSENLEQSRNVSSELTRAPSPGVALSKEPKSGGGISKILRTNSESKPVKAKRGKSRVELDDFDSSSEDSSVEEPIRPPSKQTVRPVPGGFPENSISTPANQRPNDMEERLSESPVQVSPVTSSSQSYPPALMVDTSSQEDPPSPASSPSPELIDAEDAREKKAGSSTTSASTATWSDAHLRTFFDDDADIKDLLVVVYDKSGVVPAGPDHPITGNLFREENAKLADITTRLDGMLGDWLARKMRAQSSR